MFVFMFILLRLGVEPLPADGESPDELRRRLLVLSSVPLAAIKTAFGATSKVVHPDKNHNPGAHEAMQKVNQAWQELRDPTKRGWVNDQLIYQAEQLRKAQQTLLRNQTQKAKRQKQAGPQRKEKFGGKPVKTAFKNKHAAPQAAHKGKQAASASSTKTAPSSSSQSKPSQSTASSKAKPAEASSSKDAGQEPPHKKSKCEETKEMKKSVGFFDAKESKNVITVKSGFSKAIRKFNVADWHSREVTCQVAEHFMKEATHEMHTFDFCCKKKDKVELMQKHGLEFKKSLSALHLRDVLEEASISKEGMVWLV